MAGRIRGTGSRKLLTLVLSSVAALTCGDILLRLLTPFPIHGHLANRQYDEVLLYRATPALGDIDSRGFRNPSVASTVQLVAIGDSHTYGVNAAAEDSWPYQAARTLRLSVYNYGMGGYGTLQYLYLFEQALGQKPAHVVVAPFLANDLMDYCKLAGSPYWRDRLAAVDHDPDACPHEREVRPALQALGRLAASSAILSAVDQLVVQRIRLRGLSHDPERAILVRYGEHSTLLERFYLVSHAANTDLERPEVREGWEIMRWMFEQMGRLAGDDISVSVLIVPSKESVLYESVPDSHPLHAVLKQTVLQERALTRQLATFLDERGIRTTSPLACLQDALREGPLYPSNDDSHPLARGYACYAEAVERLAG